MARPVTPVCNANALSWSVSAELYKFVLLLLLFYTKCVSNQICGSTAAIMHFSLTVFVPVLSDICVGSDARGFLPVKNRFLLVKNRDMFYRFFNQFF